MTLRIITVPCLSDNYAFILRDDALNQTALVDAPEAAPIQKVLDAEGWQLDDLVLTHHHYDHIDGVEALRSTSDCRVIGAVADQHRLPPLDVAVSPGDVFEVCGLPVQVIDTPGHTVGLVAFYIEAARALFSSDSLMAMGCGRLFEGTPDQMWDSLQRLRALPPETNVYSGHEYTTANMRFALSLEPDNAALISRSAQIDAARAAGRATVPSLLSEECSTNPFLRADSPELAQAVGLSGASSAKVFAEVRGRKDQF